MKQVNLPGHAENLAYPVTALNCDWSAADGSVKGFPDKVQQAAIAGTARGFYYYKDRWYIVAGDKLYSWQSGSPVQLASGITGADRAHFVPLASHLVVRVGNRIYTVVGNTATLVSALNAPSAPSRARVEFSFTLDTDHGGSATYSTSGDTFTLGDVADSEPGAHRFLGSSNIASGPKWVSELAVELVSWQDTISFRHPISFELWNDINSPTNRRAIAGTLVELPYPYPVGAHYVRPLAPIQLSSTLGFRFHIRHSTTWRRTVRARNIFTPTHYALTTVQSGAESPPVYFTVTPDNSTGTLTERYFVQFTSLPSGTWRLYRRDSAGVYRLVHEGAGSTYTDYKTDADLGARLIVNNPPTDGAYAIEWNRRCVIAKGSKLYISDAGAFRFTDDSEIVDVQDEVIALAVIRGQLYYGTEQGWYLLYGWGDTLTTAQVHAEPPPVGFVGDALALRTGGVYLPGVGVDDLIRKPLRKTLYAANRVLWLTQQGELYLRFPNGKWTLLSGEYMDALFHGGHLWAYDSDMKEIYRFSGDPQTLLLEWTIPLESPAQLYEARVEGAGAGTFDIRRRDNTWKTASGNLPLRHDRVEHPYYELRLRLTGTQ
ncbi:MAG: hypothetical protein N2045_14195, partial [Fimbriimonadales bacterium]|nr:hypothetical protein [Fimbriimonadales bacterium]